MRRKLTATLISKLTVPDGKKSIKIFDTEVAGLGVRKMATGIASFIFEKRGTIKAGYNISKGGAIGLRQANIC